MKAVLKLPFTLPSLNQYIDADREHYQKGAKMKREWQCYVNIQINFQLKGVRFNKPVRMHYHWIEKNQKRDMDNISSFGRKVIQDALVKSGVLLLGDGWKGIKGFTDEFHIDKDKPGIVIILDDEEDEIDG